jgi:hypothetical protein
MSGVFAFKIFLVMPSLANQLEQTTPRVVVVFMNLQVILKLVNAGR